MIRDLADYWGNSSGVEVAFNGPYRKVEWGGKKTQQTEEKKKKEGPKSNIPIEHGSRHPKNKTKPEELPPRKKKGAEPREKEEN